MLSRRATLPTLIYPLLFCSKKSEARCPGSKVWLEAVVVDAQPGGVNMGCADLPAPRYRSGAVRPVRDHRTPGRSGNTAPSRPIGALTLSTLIYPRPANANLDAPAGCDCLQGGRDCLCTESHLSTLICPHRSSDSRFYAQILSRTGSGIEITLMYPRRRDSLRRSPDVPVVGAPWQQSTAANLVPADVVAGSHADLGAGVSASSQVRPPKIASPCSGFYL